MGNHRPSAHLYQPVVQRHPITYCLILIWLNKFCYERKRERLWSLLSCFARIRRSGDSVNLPQAEVAVRKATPKYREWFGRL